jgi:Tfp pilus assembly protein PilO
MAENPEQNLQPDAAHESEILTNDYGATRDGTVVVEEATRTVLLTENETIVIEKEPRLDIVPKNRPRRVYAGLWGSTEIATVGLGLLAILSVIILFMFVVLPAQKELEKNRAERDRLEAELISTRGKYGDAADTETQIARLTGSVDDFESRFLPVAATGRTALYQRINGLIAAYGLVNTSGPEYAPMEISGSDGRAAQTTESGQGRAKFQSLFPGVYVATTVEGSYQNLRRFIRDIETSEQFVVISAVELAPAENGDKNTSENSSAQQASITGAKITPMQNQLPPQQGIGAPNAVPGIQYQSPGTQQPLTTTQQQTQPATRPVRGKTRGETVSLHLEMAAYFRRPSVVQTSIVNQ